MRMFHGSRPQRSEMSVLVRLLVVGVFVVGHFAGWSPTMHPVAARGPSFHVDAPQQVAVGAPIELGFTLHDVRDIAGYEATLLYDTAVVEFDGLQQRNHDLKKFGRDVGPLPIAETPRGVSVGLYSCPTDDCVGAKGRRAGNGGRGTVKLATLSLVANQPGLLEIKLDATKFVDAAGTAVSVDVPVRTIMVQVGAAGAGPRYAAPGDTHLLGTTSALPAGPFDLTGDGFVTHADAMEVAIAWMVAREHGTPCAASADLTRDVNHDGCIDVSDAQLVAAQYRAVPASGSAGWLDWLVPAARAEANTQVVAQSTSFVVNSTADAADAKVGNGVCATAANECTLRAAIQEANVRTGPDTIAFNISGTGVHTIQLANSLPTVSDATGPTTIDGYTQPGATPNTDPLVSNAVLKIQIVGTGADFFSGLYVSSGSNVIRGLSMYNFKRAIVVTGSGATDNVITGNFIGTNAAATYVAPSFVFKASGVYIITGAPRTRVGGRSPAERNVLSGNANCGAQLADEGTDNTVVVNNLVGLKPSGDGRLRNQNHGVDVNGGARFTQVGGTSTGERNVISGNNKNGVEVSHMPGTSQNHVVGNFIGTDVTGSTGPAYAANYLHGVNVEDGVTNNFVYDNVIGNNQGAGVQICCRLTPGNQVYNNRIGISLNGTAIPNTLAGVQVGSDASKATIGPNNIITNNAVGIAINTPKSDFNTITRNSIYHNVGLGIDLTPSGTVNPNDAGDGDSGANQQLNFPVLTDATTVEVKGTACVTCTVEIFLADGGEGAYGEGKTFVGAAAVGSDGKFTTPVQGVNAGNVVTATATDANGNTSEFSRNRGVVQAPSEPTVTVYAADTFGRTITDGWGRANTGGAYTLTGTAANFDVNGNAGTILVPAAGTSRMASLTSVSARDVNLTVRVQTNKVATGGGQYAYLVARSVNSNTYYQGQLRFTATGSVTVHASRLVSGTSTALGSEVVAAGLTHTPHSMINVRMQAVGTNPTTLRIKAWADKQAEPAAWQYSVTDTSASLQVAGSVGLRTTVPSTATNAPVLFTFDDFRVTSVQP